MGCSVRFTTSQTSKANHGPSPASRKARSKRDQRITSTGQVGRLEEMTWDGVDDPLTRWTMSKARKWLLDTIMLQDRLACTKPRLRGSESIVMILICNCKDLCIFAVYVDVRIVNRRIARFTDGRHHRTQFSLLVGLGLGSCYVFGLFSLVPVMDVLEHVYDLSDADFETYLRPNVPGTFV